MDLDPQVLELGVRLTESAARNTASAIGTRTKAARKAKGDREALAELEEIVNDLLEQRAELIQIAQAYKEELVAQRISEDDVTYITTELVPKLRAVIEMSASGGSRSATPDEIVEILNSLLSVETLTVMQLLGFNFKRAIGEPLTDLLAQVIRSKEPERAADMQRRLIGLSLDQAAYERFMRLIGQDPQPPGKPDGQEAED